MTKQQLLALVLEQIKEDVLNGDLTAIEELIRSLSEERLVSFLHDQAFEETAES